MSAVAAVVVLAGAGIFVVFKVAGASSGDGLPAVSGPHRVAQTDAGSGTASGAASGGADSSGAAPAGHWVGLRKKWLDSTNPQSDTNSANPTSETVGTDGTRVFLAQAKIPKPEGGPWPPGTVSAYDPATGKQLWRVPFQWAPGSVPVGAGNVVVLASGDEFLDGSDHPIDIVGLDSTSGKELWRRHAGATDANPFALTTFTRIDVNNSAPGVFFNGLFYYGDVSTIYAVDPATGRDKYTHTMHGYDMVNGPVVSGGQIVYAVKVNDQLGDPDQFEDTHLFVTKPDLSGGTGVLLHKGGGTDEGCGDIAETWVVAGGDTILVGTQDQLCGFRYTPDNQVNKLWSIGLSRQNFYAPVDGVVPLLDFTDEPRSVIIGLDAATGKQVWKNDPYNGKNPSRDDIGAVLARTEIAVADGTLFSIGYHLQIIDTKTGKTIFDANPKGPYGQFGADAAPAVAAGTVVMYRADGLWGFD